MSFETSTELYMAGDIHYKLTRIRRYPQSEIGDHALSGLQTEQKNVCHKSKFYTKSITVVAEKNVQPEVLEVIQNSTDKTIPESKISVLNCDVPSSFEVKTPRKEPLVDSLNCLLQKEQISLLDISLEEFETFLNTMKYNDQGALLDSNEALSLLGAEEKSCSYSTNTEPENIYEEITFPSETEVAKLVTFLNADSCEKSSMKNAKNPACVFDISNLSSDYFRFGKMRVSKYGVMNCIELMLQVVEACKKQEIGSEKSEFAYSISQIDVEKSINDCISTLASFSHCSQNSFQNSTPLSEGKIFVNSEESFNSQSSDIKNKKCELQAQSIDCELEKTYPTKVSVSIKNRPRSPFPRVKEYEPTIRNASAQDRATYDLRKRPVPPPKVVEDRPRFPTPNNSTRFKKTLRLLNPTKIFKPNKGSNKNNSSEHSKLLNLTIKQDKEEKTEIPNQTTKRSSKESKNNGDNVEIIINFPPIPYQLKDKSSSHYKPPKCLMESCKLVYK